NEPVDKRIKQMNQASTAQQAAAIEAVVKPKIAVSLTLRFWGVDALVISSIAIDIDNFERVFCTSNNEQKISELHILSHRDWEIESIALQTVEDKRAFLHRILSPENSDQNKWLKDLNGDSSHDWRDMRIEKENVYRLEDISGDGVA